MTKHKVKIREGLERDVVVEAENEGEAIEKVKEMYRNEEVILGSEDFSYEDFSYEGEVETCPHCDIELENKMIDVDGTNLEEHNVCPECGYGTPALR